MIKSVTFGCLIAFLFTITGTGQVITDIPPNEPNNRFLDDPSLITMRPGLTIAGFSNEAGTGLGLRQLLNAAFESAGSSEFDIISKILNKAKEQITHNPELDQIEYTTNILQYMAFEAIASFVLEQNGISANESNQTYSINIREHSDVMEEFKNALIALTDNNKLVRKELNGEPFGDYLDALRSYNNIARALDLYLGIENAYQYFLPEESNPELLLTENEKSDVMNRFREDVNLLYNDGIKKVYSVTGTSINVTEDKLEAGNRPLKGYLALGTASLSVQTNEESVKETFDEYISMAISRASESVDEGERDNYWMYQTGNGNRYWAEGSYYLDLVLKDALIFWHAIRLHENFDSSFDPFFNDWFLNPVQWLADISTPDGFVPPFDDGNKRAIQSSSLLRWNKDYGNEEIGELYNKLYDAFHHNHNTLPLEDQFYLIEAAIPFTGDLANQLKSLVDTTGQQLIIRHSESGEKNHYIALNGENNGAITSGEGHEQPDQLQLLYYMDEYSYLIDPGYDEGNPQTNSTWNGYRHTNTMQYNASDIRTNMDFVIHQNEGGLESPYASFIQLRKVSIHNNAKLHYEEAAPGVDLISGHVQIEYQIPLPARANYHRTVLVVKGDGPYLIDINDIFAETGRNDFVMRYHGFSNQSGHDNGWFFWDKSGQPYTSPTNRLYLFTVPLIGKYTDENDTIEIQEYENRGPDDEKQPYPVIRRSLISNEESDRFATASILKIRESAPAREPLFVTNAQTLSYFTHQIDPETIDLFVFASDTTETKRTFSIHEGPLSGLELTLSQSKTIGLTRLMFQNDAWVQSPDYTFNLKLISAPGAPNNLTVSIESQASGPAAVLNWNQPGEENIEFYQVWRQIRNVENLNEESADQIGTTTSTEFADLSITDYPVGKYEFRWFVKAVNSDSLESAPSNTTEWIRLDDSDSPSDFKLFDPYPNPTNREARFKYQLPEQSVIIIQIFDMLGRHVSTLTNEELEPGIYTKLWQTEGLASGTYIIQMRAESVSGSSFENSVVMSVIK